MAVRSIVDIVYKPVVDDGPERSQPISPGDFLALFVAARPVRDRYFVDAAAALGKFGGQFRFQIKVIAADRNGFQNTGSGGFIKTTCTDC